MQDYEQKFKEFEELLKDIQPKDVNASKKSNPKLLENHILKYGLIPPYTPKKSYLDLRNQQNKNWAYQQTIEGIALFKNNEINSAKKKYNAAIELDGECVEAVVARGCCYASEKKYKDALNDFESALKIDPNHKNAKQYRDQIQSTIDKISREKKSTEKSLRNGEFILPENFGRGKKKEVYVAKEKLPLPYEKQYEFVDEDYGYKKKKKKKRSKRDCSPADSEKEDRNSRKSSDKYSREGTDRYSRQSSDRDYYSRDRSVERKKDREDYLDKKSEKSARETPSEYTRERSSEYQSRDRSNERRSSDRDNSNESRNRSRDRESRHSKRSRLDKSP
ncbi:Tetratricopeptide repeat protein 14 [Boothiomyces sp. JEL0866]|nr:Tetratricopeptide repeat protein 14 [Boothiomyces sp. JEL0866]